MSYEPERQFRDALTQAGLVLDEQLIADGKIQRCDVVGKKGGRDGAYLLNLYPNFAAGGFQNWTDGAGWQKWWYRKPGWTPTPEEQAEIDEAIEQARTEAEKERAEAEAVALAKARRMWADANLASPEHPYCARKGVKPDGLRSWRFADGTTSLLVPVLDGEEKLMSLQYIPEEGKKKFKRDCRVGGGHFWVCEPSADPAGTICICEGWATGESIYQATQHNVVIAFFAGNMLAVAEWVRARNPQAKIILCADDDWRTEGNPGLTKAREAAAKVNGYLAVPKFDANRGEKDTDFNDMVRATGAELVKAVIEKPSRVGELLPIIELARLDRITYDRRRKQAAKDLGVRSATLDEMVAETRAEEAADAEAGALLPHWIVEPWPEPVDTGILLRAVEARITRHVATLGKRAVVPALWTMFSWVHDAATHSPNTAPHFARA